MAGKVIEIKVNVGDSVHEDDEVAVIEAMKMEMLIMSDTDGTVKEIKVKKGIPLRRIKPLMIVETKKPGIQAIGQVYMGFRKSLTFFLPYSSNFSLLPIAYAA
jgi:hypothetical protein